MRCLGSGEPEPPAFHELAGLGRREAVRAEERAAREPWGAAGEDVGAVARKGLPRGWRTLSGRTVMRRTGCLLYPKGATSERGVLSSAATRVRAAGQRFSPFEHGGLSLLAARR